MTHREHWKSRLGFIWAATGSAVGLGSIWRFPYVVGQNGGAAFVLLFCIFLFLVSLPVLIAEIAMGRKAQLSPAAAYGTLGGIG
jgi:NSS family neurotransmitter:Na+ symporter